MSAHLDTLLLQHTRDILLLVERAQLTIVYASEPTLRILGYAQEQLIGRPIADLECALADVFFWEEVAQQVYAPAGTDCLFARGAKEGAYLCADGQVLPVSKTVLLVDGDASKLLVRAELLDSRHQIENELAYVSSRLRATLEATADGVLLVDRLGRIVNMNQRFSQMWVLSDELLIKHDDAQIFAFMASAFDDPDAYCRALAAIEPDAEDETFDVLYLADGRVFERKSRPALHGEQIIGRVFSFSDATERMRTQQALIDARDQAKEASRAKSEFLAMMSHEIRTPMNGVIGMAQLLAMTPLNTEQAEYAHTICSSGEALLSIINDILDYSKIEAKKLSLESVDFSLPELLREVEQLFTAHVGSSEVRYSSRLGFGLPVMVKGDALRLRQILVNLIGNAFKFTSRGQVSLDVREIKAPPGKIVLRFSVQDTGIGIPKQKLERIFRPFEQADSSTTRRYGGSGLGLSICSLLTEMMGGEMGVESEEGKGSDFWFTVLMQRVETSQVLRPVLIAETILRRDIRILIAEDNQVNQVVLRNMLGKLGAHEVVMVGNGEAALDACRQEKFDLIFMDVYMPEMDGLQASNLLRAEGVKARIIGVSAGVLNEHKQAAFVHGMDDYLPKPITLKALKEVIARWRDTMRAVE
ncbi:MAG: ATP-binding protein [Pseudomonadota bacterium]